MSSRTYTDTNATGENRTETNDEREHTGLRTVEPHYSAAEVYHELHCDYPGAGGVQL